MHDVQPLSHSAPAKLHLTPTLSPCVRVSCRVSCKWRHPNLLQRRTNRRPVQIGQNAVEASRRPWKILPQTMVAAYETCYGEPCCYKPAELRTRPIAETVSISGVMQETDAMRIERPLMGKHDACVCSFKSVNRKVGCGYILVLVPSLICSYDMSDARSRCLVCRCTVASP